MRTPIIKVSNLSEEETNTLYNTCKRKVDKNSLTQFYSLPLDSGLAIFGSDCNDVFDTEIECFSYNEFMKLYKECSLEHTL